MYIPPPYQPHFDPNLYDMARSAKREVRRTSNALCWTLLAALFLMTGIMLGCTYYLKAIGFQADYSGGSDFRGFTPVLYYLANDVGYVVGLAVPVLIYFAVKHLPLSEALPFQKTNAAKVWACVAFSVAVCMLANIPANLVVSIEKALGFSGNMPQMPLTDDPAVLILYGVTIAVIPPIVEELLFRGMILGALRKYGDTFAVVGSALLFGMYHGNFVQMVFAFIAGLVMAQAVIRTGSLWTSIIIHFFNNSISIAMEMVQRYAGEETANQVNVILMGVIIVLGILALIYLLRRDRNFFRGEPHNPMFRLSERIGALLWNPGGVAMILFALISSIEIMVSY